jgi:hypothetical protein
MVIYDNIYRALHSGTCKFEKFKYNFMTNIVLKEEAIKYRNRIEVNYESLVFLFLSFIADLCVGFHI